MWRETVLPPLSLVILTVPLGDFSRSMWGLYRDLFPGIDVHMPLPGHFKFFLFAAFLKKSA